MLEPLSYRIEVPCSQKKAFEVFAGDFSSWWPLDKRAMSTYATGNPAKGLSVDARLGGKIIETGADHSEHHWGTFTAYDPYGYLAFDFHMGLPAEQTGKVEVKFVPLDDSRTMVELIHSNWEGYGDMADAMHNGYGSSWHMLFEECYKAACETP